MTNELTERLHQGNHSLVVRQGETTRCFDNRGVADLYRLLTEEPRMLREAVVADKVVGKAAAALMLLGGVKELYADIISSFALELLRQSSMQIHYTEQVDHIINRNHTGWCPMETLCKECHTAEECLREVETFMRSVRTEQETKNIENKYVTTCKHQ